MEIEYILLDPAKAHILLLRGNYSQTQLDTLARSMKGIFPDKTPVLFNTDDTIDIYEYDKETKLKITASLSPLQTKIFKMILPDHDILPTGENDEN